MALVLPDTNLALAPRGMDFNPSFDFGFPKLLRRHSFSGSPTQRFSGSAFWDAAGRESQSAVKSIRAQKNWSKAKKILKISQISSAFQDSSPLATVKRDRERQQARVRVKRAKAGMWAKLALAWRGMWPKQRRARIGLGTILALLAVLIAVVLRPIGEQGYSIFSVYVHVLGQIRKEMENATAFHERHPIETTSLAALHVSRNNWHQAFKMLNDEVEDDFTITDVDDQLRVFFNIEIAFLLVLAYLFATSMVGDRLLAWLTRSSADGAGARGTISKRVLKTLLLRGFNHVHGEIHIFRVCMLLVGVLVVFNIPVLTTLFRAVQLSDALQHKLEAERRRRAAMRSEGLTPRQPEGIKLLHEMEVQSIQRKRTYQVRVRRSRGMPMANSSWTQGKTDYLVRWLGEEEDVLDWETKHDLEVGKCK